jgi:hypothetical protein
MNNKNVIDITSLLLQVLSLEILFKDYNNSDLMKELQHQNKEYFEKIISQNNEILKILKERS